MGNAANLAMEIERIKANAERDIKRLEEKLDKLNRDLQNNPGGTVVTTPRQQYAEMVKAKAMSSAGQAFHDGYTQLCGRRHWRYVTQEAIAKQAGKSVSTIKRGQKELQEAGVIYVQHVYRARRGKPGARRSASLIWNIGLSKRVAEQIQSEELKDVSAHNLHSKADPSVIAELGVKIPPKDKLKPRKNKPDSEGCLSVKIGLSKCQTDTNSFIDTLAVGQAGKSASPERES